VATLGLIADGWSFDEIVAEYPGLTVEDIRACAAYARDVVAEVRALPAAIGTVRLQPTISVDVAHQG